VCRPSLHPTFLLKAAAAACVSIENSEKSSYDFFSVSVIHHLSKEFKNILFFKAMDFSVAKISRLFQTKDLFLYWYVSKFCSPVFIIVRTCYAQLFDHSRCSFISPLHYIFEETKNYWSYGSWDLIPPGYRAVVKKAQNCFCNPHYINKTHIRMWRKTFAWSMLLT
jgi:hypothetical protein